jgi:hypothetical protein
MWRFEPVQPELFGGGNTLVNAWADVDADGDLDLFVGFGAGASRLYRNDAGTFVDAAQAAGLGEPRATRAAAFGDVDADGDPDLIVGYAPGDASTLKLYRNDRGAFVDVTGDVGLTTKGGAVRQLTWVDVDADADLDLFVGFRDRANGVFVQIDGRFKDVAAAIGLADPRKTVGAVWLDVDEDDDLDLVVANMDGDANAVYRNDGGRYTDVAGSLGLEWGGRAPKQTANGTVRPCAADVDNDGHTDLFFANYGPNGLFRNRGGGKFEDVSQAWGVAIDGRYDSCAFADVDHDGDLDLYVNGTVTGGVSYRDYLFRNTGKTFADVTPDYLQALHADHGVQWADFDRDGDLDLALTGTRPDGMHALLRNGLAPDLAARSLQVRVVDATGQARFAGADVCVRYGAARRLMCRVVDSGSGYNAQNDMPVHFGLPEPVRTVSVFVLPRQGRTESVRVNAELSEYLGKPLVVVVK